MRGIPSPDLNRVLAGPVPRRGWVQCTTAALLAPFVGALPDVLAGHGRLPWSVQGSWGAPGAWPGGLLLVILLGLLSALPVLAASREAHRRPLVYGIAFAAWLGAVLAAYGMAYRVVRGDGLEIVAVLYLGLGAGVVGAVAGQLLDEVVMPPRLRGALVPLALAVSVLGALAWSAHDAATFWPTQPVAAPSSARPASVPEPELESKPERACIGHASDDGRIRLFSADECAQLDGRFYPNGECLMREGGSFSATLAGMNRRCP